MLIKQIQCRCGQLLGEREGNTLVYGEIRLELRRSHKIECSKCGTRTDFNVDSKSKDIDKKNAILR